MLERGSSSLPKLPPFDHQPKPYEGPDADAVRRARQHYRRPPCSPTTRSR